MKLPEIINALKSGSHQLHVDTSNLLLLKQILTAAFPKDKCNECLGIFQAPYFIKSKRKNFWLLRKKPYNLPVVRLSEVEPYVFQKLIVPKNRIIVRLPLQDGSTRDIEDKLKEASKFVFNFLSAESERIFSENSAKIDEMLKKQKYEFLFGDVYDMCEPKFITPNPNIAARVTLPDGSTREVEMKEGDTISFHNGGILITPKTIRAT